MMRHNILCIAFLLFASTAQAQIGGIKQPDGSWIIKGQWVIIGDTQYICRGNECLTQRQAIRKLENAKPVDYMKDVRERETVDRYTLTEQHIDMSEADYNDDQTPLLGKAQNKLNELGSELLRKIF